MEMQLPRKEYPRPQMVRDTYLNLNGEWEFEIDQGRSGLERELHLAGKLKGHITVPFCPESVLSGVGVKDFMASVWYRRTFRLPDEFRGKRVLLHFEAVDNEADVWINGIKAGSHTGGYTPFTLDISPWVKEDGENVLTVWAKDDTRAPQTPSGKQSSRFHSYGCLYTRTTGIWQTVWLEAVPYKYIRSIRMIAEIEEPAVDMEIRLNCDCTGLTLKTETTFEGRPTGSTVIKLNGSYARIHIPLKEKHLWEPGHGRLYEANLSLSRDISSDLGLPDDSGLREGDEVRSYFGLRTISLRDGKFILNGKPLFMRTVLDQGYYPDGIYTAPSDKALKQDIIDAMRLGFNGARLHQKVFEQRFLYHADCLGYMVWGEYGDWGCDRSVPESFLYLLRPFREVIERDFSHPSIIGWCPTNECPINTDTRVLAGLYEVIREMDSTRPVIDSSGWVHTATDILDWHDYDQNSESFRSKLEQMKDRYSLPHYRIHPAGRGLDRELVDLISREDYAFMKNENGEPLFKRKPYFMSEYGGIWWDPGRDEGWGYGNRPATMDEFKERFKNLTEALLFHPQVCGLCYTQLTDVEQEVNGLLTYDRKMKFDQEFINAILTQKAAIEEKV